MRLTFLLEEALERLGAPGEGTLGEKVRAVEAYLEAQDGGLLGHLWDWVQLRNQVVHRRIPVPEGALERGARLAARLLRLVEAQGLYTWKELENRLTALQAVPARPPLTPRAIEPDQARAPELDPAPRPLEIPQRRFPSRPLEGGMRLVLPRYTPPKRR